MALPPLDTAPLFGPLHAELMALLRSLDEEDWLRPTVAGSWRVRDVAAHMLDTSLRRLSASRDGHLLPAPEPIETAADLARFVNRLNADGVSYAARLSPRLLTNLLEIAGRWVAELVAALPPDGRAIFGVSWAGEHASRNWMDIGREYTEHWHHQQQIRDAVGRPLLLEPRWLSPLLDVSVRALPFAYREIAARDGAAVRLVVDDQPAWTWTLTKSGGRWDLDAGGTAEPNAVVRVTGDTAWRMFYNALPGEALTGRVSVTGDAELAGPLLRTRSIVI